MTTRAKSRLNELLEQAVQKKKLNDIPELIKKGANLNFTDNLGNSLLHKIECLETISLLLSLGADVNTRNFSGETPLLYAIKNRCKSLHYELLSDFFKTNKSIKIIWKRISYLNGINRCDTPFLCNYIWLNQCDTHTVRNVLYLGSNVLRICSSRNILLNETTLNDNCKINLVRLLLEKGANPNIANCSGETPLHFSVHYNYCSFDIITELLKYGASLGVQSVYGLTPLDFALGNLLCGLPIIQELLRSDKLGLTVNQPSAQGFGSTPLLLALFFNRDIKVVKELLNCGAQANMKDKLKRTLLHMVAINPLCDGKVVSLLIKHGVEVNANDNKHQTPLHFAFKCKIINFSVVRALLHHGADISARDNDLFTPFHLAVCNKAVGEQFLIELLSEKNIEMCFYGQINNLLSLCVSYECYNYSFILLKYIVLKGHNSLVNNKFLSIFSTTWRTFLNLEPIDSKILERLFPLYTSCMNDIAFMTLDKLTKRINFLHIVNTEFSQLTFCESTEYKNEIIKKVIHRLKHNFYPCYTNFIIYLRKIDFAQYLVSLQIYTRKNKNKKLFLDPCSVYNIIKFLSKQDVINLIIAYTCKSHKINKRKNAENKRISVKRKASINLDISRKRKTSKIKNLSQEEIPAKVKTHLVSQEKLSSTSMQLRKNSVLADLQYFLRRSNRIRKEPIRFALSK